MSNTAYVLLWFPKPTETFIFHEVLGLRRQGLPLKVYTLYGRWKGDRSSDIDAAQGVERLGTSVLPRIAFDLLHWLGRAPLSAKELLAAVSLRRGVNLEKAGENLWSLLCGFHLARRFLEDKIDHIHAGWAAGPATAAWVASRLTGIPFSFSARAWDIYPPDGALHVKIRDSAFVRSETGAAISHLKRLGGDQGHKLRLVYNCLTIPRGSEAVVPMRPPIRLLAIGRFVGKKGFPVLLRSCRTLRERGFDFRLILAGSGPLQRTLTALCKRLNLEGLVTFPGFVPHDRIPELLHQSDMLIVPSLVHRTGDRDGIPTVIMEALSCRVPVVAADVAGIGEVVRDGVTGLLVPPGDPFSLAEAIARLAFNRELALGLAEEGRRLVLRQFDPERNCRSMLDLILGVRARAILDTRD